MDLQNNTILRPLLVTATLANKFQTILNKEDRETKIIVRAKKERKTNNKINKIQLVTLAFNCQTFVLLRFIFKQF